MENDLLGWSSNTWNAVMPPSPVDLRITDLDLTSEHQLRSFWEVEQDAQRADRDNPILRGFDAFVRSATAPSEYAERVWLLATIDEDVVGVAELELPTADNTHLGEIEINVCAGSRRAGVGRALHDEVVRRARAAGRRTLTSEVMSRDESGSAAESFATAIGYRAVHVEHHLSMALPVGTDLLTDLSNTDPAYEILTWEGACPDELRPAYLTLRNQMNADVPTGELDHEPVVLDDARLRSQETRSAASYLALVAAARERGSGSLVGYSLIYLPTGDASLAHQDDTLVLPPHRGHRLGLALKGANLERLAREHPTRRSIDTWTDPANLAMSRTNEQVGFTPLEVMHAMELSLS